MSSFNMKLYKKTIKNYISISFNRKTNTNIIQDILLDDTISRFMSVFKQFKKIKQLQMKIGQLWEFIIINYRDYEKADIKTGLDIVNHNKKLIFEIKNRYNTDNYSSKKSNYNKLSEFKRQNKNYRCIYGVINDKTINGQSYVFKHNNVDIEYISGNQLFTLIFNDDREEIISSVKKEINATLQQI